MSGAQKSRWELGRQGEAIAAAYLRERGMRIAESNFRAAQGEIDLIGYDGDTLCFIEVKYRETERAGSPEEAVTTQKQRVICRTADYYRHLHRLDDTVKIRFDVVAVRSEGEDIHWIRNAFAYTGMGS
ncbi:MAG: YraN family protein [Eubacteriales bacterium]|nr:YraN family protein [Eubacteriales bacterium]